MEEKEARYLDPNDWSIGPCWYVRNCPSEWRGKCAAWEYEASLSCWEVNGTYCQGSYRSSREKDRVCHSCEVYRAGVVGGREARTAHEFVRNNRKKQ